MNYFNQQSAIVLHNYVIEISGGCLGVKDNEPLKSTLEFVKNDDYYPSFEKKLCYLIYSIAMNHAFIDGNKRTAIILGGLLMSLNGFSNLIPEYFNFMEGLVLNLVENGLKRSKFEEIMEFYLKNGNLKEEYLLLILVQRQKALT